MDFWQRLKETFGSFTGAAGNPETGAPVQWWADREEARAIARYLERSEMHTSSSRPWWSLQ